MISLALLEVHRVPRKSASICKDKNTRSNGEVCSSAEVQCMTSLGSYTKYPEKLAAARAAPQ